MTCAAVLACAAYACIARYGVDLVDEGYFLDLASRVQQGQLPYRDFDTYYTPGVFYLDVLVFTLFGVGVVPVRAVMIVVRIASGLLLYGLARRIMPWYFALVPPILLLAADLTAGPHPAWVAMLSALLMVELIARGRANPRWLTAAGAAAGLAFMFKQNVGAFAVLGAVGYVLLVPRPGAGVGVLALRLLYAVGVALEMRAFLNPAWNELVAATLWLPLVGSLILLLGWQRPGSTPASWTTGLRFVVTDTTHLLAGFVGITLAWLVPLMSALTASETPFHLFLGSVNQGALIFPLEPPPAGAPSLVLAALWLPVVLAAFQRQAPLLVAPVTVAVLATLLVPLLPTRFVPSAPLVMAEGVFPRLEVLDSNLGTMYLYLPALAAWSGLLLLVGRRTAPGPPPLVTCYLLVGTFAQFALYPRADTAHALFAGGLLFVVGAWVLSEVHRLLGHSASRAGQASIYAALLLIPAAAILPLVYGRYIGFAHPEPPLASAVYEPLDLERAELLAPRGVAEPLRQVVTYLRERTSPDEPLFAYPVDPLVNFLVDRPNPTRFSHFMPGALTAGDLAQVVGDIEAARPRYILWDHAGVIFWRTDTSNGALTDYIWRCYTQVAAFGFYLVLERTQC